MLRRLMTPSHLLPIVMVVAFGVGLRIALLQRLDNAPALVTPAAVAMATPVAIDSDAGTPDPNLKVDSTYFDDAYLQFIHPVTCDRINSGWSRNDHLFNTGYGQLKVQVLVMSYPADQPYTQRFSFVTDPNQYAGTGLYFGPVPPGYTHVLVSIRVENDCGSVNTFEWRPAYIADTDANWAAYNAALDRTAEMRRYAEKVIPLGDN